MKIWLIDHYTNPPSEMGDARHYSNARELIQRGHEARVIACSFDHLKHAHYAMCDGCVWDNQMHDSVPFTIIKARPYQTNFEPARILNMLEFAFRAWKADWAKGLPAPDLILGSAPDPFVALAAERLAARHKVPFVLEIRDAWPYAIQEVTGHSRRHPFVWVVDKIMRYLYRRAQRIIMLSRHSADLLVEYGADESKIVWIPQGVDMRINPDPGPAREEGTFTVMYLGAHNPWNSLDHILDAAKILRDAGDKNIVFRFVGDGTSKAELKERAGRESLTNVRFEDPVPKNRVYEVQSESSAFIINNRKDGASQRWMSFNKLYNYLAAARPVVFGSHTENDLVREAGAGISVPAGDAASMADAIRHLASISKEERDAYGARGRSYIEEHYSIPVLMNRFEAMAREIAS